MCKPEFLSAKHNLTEIAGQLDITTDLLTSLLVFHESLDDTECFITIIVVPWLETVAAHEVSRMAMMSLEKVELVRIELVVGDMGGRVFFRLSKKLVALGGTFIII
jgi:hypothetical protein